MKRVARCRSCKEELHHLVYLEGGESHMKQCLNRQCKQYGKAVS